MATRVTTGDVLLPRLESSMKAPSFSYVKPGSLGEVFDLLERHAERARVLAGGQSLLASLNLR
jgi:carbon-monoxide dehydrogenase medium subunit